MKIDLKKLLSGNEELIKFNHLLQFPDLIYGAYHPIKGDIIVKGVIFSKASVVHLDADVSFEFSGFCDRCASDIKREMQFSLQKIIVNNLQKDDNFDDYIVAENDMLDLDKVIEEEIILFFPSKMLCKENCHGLCHQCGKNLNMGKCDCKTDIDPRMEILLQLLDEE